MTQPITPASVPGGNNLFANFPPAIPMVVIAVVLVGMAQFGSTERLATAFAWLIFVAVLFANGPQAFSNLTSLMSGTTAPAATTSTTSTTTTTTNKGTA